MACTWRIAVASTGSGLVDRSLEGTRSFLIAEVGEDGRFRLLESRKAGQTEDNAEISWTLPGILEMLQGCSGVLAARAEPKMKKALAERCITVFELPIELEVALSRISDYFTGCLPSDG